jgi:hypothetical protein
MRLSNSKDLLRVVYYYGEGEFERDYPAFVLYDYDDTEDDDDLPQLFYILFPLSSG